MALDVDRFIERETKKRKAEEEFIRAIVRDEMRKQQRRSNHG